MRPCPNMNTRIERMKTRKRPQQRQQQEEETESNALCIKCHRRRTSSIVRYCNVDIVCAAPASRTIPSIPIPIQIIIIIIIDFFVSVWPECIQSSSQHQHNVYNLFCGEATSVGNITYDDIYATSLEEYGFWTDHTITFFTSL